MKELGYFVYQIYPKSFLDTTGNGIGDINGIRKKLRYIKGLGFDYIWLTPMYVSPQKDNGYDVADYRKIDPLFGTEHDFDMLIKEATELGLQVMMDMVFNHTSDQHQWFQKALSGDQHYQEYYIWSESPTTWESKFGGGAWEYAPSVGKYYLHLFDKSQPDLNWENENVRKEIYDIVNYWIKRGVKGFRFDVINLISKRYPLVNGEGDGRLEYTDGPRIHEFLTDLRTNTFASDESILTVGEMSSTSITACCKYAGPKRDELDSVFHFHHLKVDYLDMNKWSKDHFDFEMLKDLFKTWQLAMQDAEVVDTLFWSNHDQPRIASRFIAATNAEEQLRKNKMIAMMMYLMRGISYIYQGEEIGMENLKVTSIDDLVDVESINYYNASTDSIADKLAILSQKSRDNGRTPMQWNASGGFSDSTPWLKQNENFTSINVDSQLTDTDSTYSFYQQIINLKKNDNVLIYGKIEFIDDPKLLIYTRTLAGVTYMVITNVWNEEIAYPAKFKNVIINNGCELSGEVIKILPFGSLLIEV
ncbi:alpha,alpha-phosphotrehalase [Mollicutes bacterium LVI A0039]|nr:alpha,alpha-phosphotrehalase [Mollicutes bacterium LVI A0039]